MVSSYSSSKVVLLCSTIPFVLSSPLSNLESRLTNGLALTPPMGWNSYNHYSCVPNQTIVFSNAQALVDLGLQAAGYHYVTIDCGWTLPSRSLNGSLPWNPDRFPGGPYALSQFLHTRGLGFGVYSDGGTEMCMTGTPAQAGSLYHETVDADSFASWGADLLKYDNCYSDAATGYPATQYTPSASPYSDYVTMSNAIAVTGRKILFQICEWGVDFPSAWAPKLGNSWRITNDIIPFWKTIPRILNQVVSQTDFAGPGHWLDLDMMEVGNNVFTTPEEQTHFSLWAMIKSPLVIGAALKDNYRTISAGSLAILKNPSVISYNQDSLGVAASFRRRWTQAGYEVWAGPLSGGRTVVGLINLLDKPQTLTLDLPDVGLQSAAVVKDIWNDISSKKILTSYTALVQAHGTLLLELQQTALVGTYGTDFATTTGKTTTYRSIYGITSSTKYSLTITYPSSSPKGHPITVNGINYHLGSNNQTLTVPLTLLASATNAIAITSYIPPLSLTVAPPPSNFYPSTSFRLSGTSALTTCASGLCIPVGSKLGFLSPTGTASLTLANPSSSTSPKYLSLHFCNNDIAFATSFTTGTNTRNLTIDINGVVTRVEVPLSGRSSELYSPGLGWQDTGVFGVLVGGWKTGSNVLTVGNVGAEGDLQTFAADVVGVAVFW